MGSGRQLRWMRQERFRRPKGCPQTNRSPGRAPRGLHCTGMMWQEPPNLHASPWMILPGRVPAGTRDGNQKFLIPRTTVEEEDQAASRGNSVCAMWVYV